MSEDFYASSFVHFESTDMLQYRHELAIAEQNEERLQQEAEEYQAHLEQEILEQTHGFRVTVQSKWPEI